MFACGNNDSGQLGTGTRKTEMLPVPVMSSVIFVTCGNHWTFVITNKGEVWGTGGNENGQLGLGHKKSTIVFTKIEQLAKVKIKKVAAGCHTGALSVDGDLYFWGTGVFGEELFPRKVVVLSSKLCDLAIGGTIGVALDVSGKVWVWGSNNFGELGIGNYDPCITPFQLKKLKNKHIASINCGKSFVVVRCQRKTAVIGDSYGSEGDKVSELNSTLMAEGTISNIDSDFSLKDPNQNIILVLTRQRDYLEETLDKERNEKKSVENKNSELRSEIATLKNCIERIEKEKIESMNNTNELIDKLNTTTHKLDEAYKKIAEIEKHNEALLKSIEDKEMVVSEVNKFHDNTKKKYTKAKKTIHAHIEAQEKLVKENDVLMQKLKAQKEKYEVELNRHKEVSPKKNIKIEELQSQLIESNTIKEHQAKLIEENEMKIASLTNMVQGLQDRVHNIESEKADLQNELLKQKSLTSKYEEDLKELDKEFRQVKKAIKKTIITEKSKTEDIQQQYKETIQALQTENDKLTKQMQHLQTELRNSQDQILHLNNIKLDLESRNHKLIYSLTHCTKDRERTRSQQIENFTLINGKSPPRNLIVSAISSKPEVEFDTCITNSK